MSVCVPPIPGAPLHPGGGRPGLQHRPATGGARRLRGVRPWERWKASLGVIAIN